MASGSPTNVSRVVDVRRQLHNDDLRWRGMLATLIVVTLFVGAVAYVSVPRPFSIAVLLLVVACLAAFLRPVIGLYLIVFLTLVGDFVTTDWWPFFRNMSSTESIMYVNDKLILSPLEVLSAVTLTAWVLQRLGDPTWRFHRGRMFVPVMAFTALVVFGILRGRASGGDSRVAIFEYRPLFYIPLLYILCTNLLTTRRQYRRLMLLALVAIAIQSVFSLLYYRGLPPEQREVLESLTEHPATVHMNAVFVFTIAVWTLKCRAWLRWAMLALCVPVVWAYLLSQRRAAMVSLVVGVILLLVVLFQYRRRVFWFVSVTMSVVASGFVLATWNATGALGLPATAVKTVLFPDQLGESEAGSDLYRRIEAFDLWFTIKSSPLTGVGFGRKFLMPVPLPDISFFEFWEYMPHNAVLWIWLKMGALGFVAMLFLFARGLQLGARSAIAVSTQEQVATVVTGAAYIAMFIVFAYVDIAWAARNTVFLGFAFAVCADLVWAHDEHERVVEGVHHHQLESVH